MKYLTMVMRYGNLKGKDESFQYTLIGDDMSIHTIDGAKLAEGISAKKYVVTNMDVNTRGLVSTNGAIKNYTTIGADGKMVGSPKAVILNRVEKDGRLVGYIIFNVNGTVSEISVGDAATLAANNMIANGKIRHTSDGDIVASIGGNYPLLEMKNRKVQGKLYVDVTLFQSVVGQDGKTIKCAGILVTSNSAETLSKLYPTLESENKKLCNKLAKVGYANTSSMSIIRGNNGGFYGVYPIELVWDLIGKASVVTNSFGSIFIACKDLSGDEESEAGVIIDSKKLNIVEHRDGSDVANAKLKTFVKGTVSKLSEIKFK